MSTNITGDTNKKYIFFFLSYNVYLPIGTNSDSEGDASN